MAGPAGLGWLGWLAGLAGLTGLAAWAGWACWLVGLGWAVDWAGAVGGCRLLVPGGCWGSKLIVQTMRLKSVSILHAKREQ